MPIQPSPRIFQSHLSSCLGDLLLAATEQGLAGVWFVQGQEHMPDSREWARADAQPILAIAKQQLQEYFLGQRQTFDLPLEPTRGSPFQRDVWQALKQIPYGQTSTYGAIAKDIGNPKAVRAVGAAIGNNPHTIIVPCHRVLGSNGLLTGYAGGLDRKRYLLTHEVKHADRAICELALEGP